MLFKRIITITLISVLFLVNQSSANAEVSSDITIICNEGEIECNVNPSSVAPLFDDTDFPLYDLKPGDTFERSIKVINNRNGECHFTIDHFSNIIDSTSELDETFAESLKTEITDGTDTTGVLSFQTLFQSTPVYITKILGIGNSPSNIKDLIWKVSFDTEAGNEFQNAVLKFDFNWTFLCEDPVELNKTILFIKKTNNKLGFVQAPGDNVKYTITVSTDEQPVYGVKVFDLPPGGFKYRLGSWTANSNLRGDLKKLGVTTEPTYASPGTWQLGDMSEGEIVTLTYITDIDTSQESGDYPDIAWAEGIFPKEPNEDQPQVRVLGNASTGYFVGTLASVTVDDEIDVEIEIEREEEVEGKVLGATTLPSTGANALPIIIGLMFIIFGFTFIFFSKKRNTNGIKSFVIFFLTLFLLFCSFNSVNAQAITTDPFMSVRIEQPETPGNSKALNINFVVLNTEGKSVIANCYKKGPLDSTFTVFGSSINLKEGGDDAFCVADSGVLNKSGTYKFYVTANAGSGINQTNTVSVELNHDRPGKPKDLEKDENGCSYKVKFKTANDGGNTSRVEVYASKDKEYTANSSNRIEDISAGSNSNVDFTYNKPNCSKDYYFSAIAFDSAGNKSDPAVETVKVEGETQSGITEITTTAAIHTNQPSTISNEAILGDEDMVLQAQNDDQEAISEVLEKTGDGKVEGVTDINIEEDITNLEEPEDGKVKAFQIDEKYKKYFPYLIAGLLALLPIIFLIIYARKPKNTVE